MKLRRTDKKLLEHMFYRTRQSGRKPLCTKEIRANPSWACFRLQHAEIDGRARRLKAALLSADTSKARRSGRVSGSSTSSYRWPTADRRGGRRCQSSWPSGQLLPSRSLPAAVVVTRVTPLRPYGRLSPARQTLQLRQKLRPRLQPSRPCAPSYPTVHSLVHPMP
jgi:hypothetical protein